MSRLLQTVLTELLFCMVLQCLPSLVWTTMTPSTMVSSIGVTSATNITCEIIISNKSKDYFRVLMNNKHVDLIHFKLNITNLKADQQPNATPEVLMPDTWMWAKALSNGNPPYLHWNANAGVLSFGLLNAATFTKVVEMHVKVSDPNNCPIRYGTEDTSVMIGKSFINIVKKGEHRNSYWCFLAEVPGFRETIGYTLARYTNFPIDTVNYNCCHITYNNTVRQVEPWNEMKTVPYLLGLILFFFSPVLFMFFGVTIRQDTTVAMRRRGYQNIASYDEEMESRNNWVFLDGAPPVSIIQLIKKLIGLEQRFPVCSSRLVRFLFTILSPSLIYARLYMYYTGGHSQLTLELLNHSDPLGFLSILGRTHTSTAVFVPAFGGAFCMFILYLLLAGLVYILPPSFDEVLEKGSPGTGSRSTPLASSITYIESFSMEPIQGEYGYKKALLSTKASIYMITCCRFWRNAIRCQWKRYKRFCNRNNSRNNKCNWRWAILPLYIACCVIELGLCLVFYGIPFVQVIIRLSKGLMSVAQTMLRCDPQIEHNVLFSILKKICQFLFGLAFTLYGYCYFLVFTESFTFIAQVVVYCFVAVVKFPNVAFGYLFFVTMFLYYIIRLFRGFGEIYSDLLLEAVEACRNLDENPREAMVIGDRLYLHRVNVGAIKEIVYSDMIISLNTHAHLGPSCSQDSRPSHVEKLCIRHNQYGIPRDLFEHLVMKFKPIHRQVLSMLFHVAMILFLIVATFGISDNFSSVPNSEISEVMQVVFIITVGALPRVLEIFLSSSSEMVKREIHQRRIEQEVAVFYGSKMSRRSVVYEQRRRSSVPCSVQEV